MIKEVCVIKKTNRSTDAGITTWKRRKIDDRIKQTEGEMNKSKEECSEKVGKKVKMKQLLTT